MLLLLLLDAFGHRRRPINILIIIDLAGQFAI